MTRTPGSRSPGAGIRATELTHQLLAFGRREVVRPQVLNLNTVVSEIEPFLRRTIGEHIQLHTQLATDLWPVLADPGQLGILRQSEPGRTLTDFCATVQDGGVQFSIAPQA